MNILLGIAYHGGAYHGFQVQSNAVTVCATLQDGMQALFGARPDVKGCSRTDTGVHAREFCLNFHHETAISMEKLPLALNAHLPRDIRVLWAKRVPEAFHARYSATGKEYEYRMRNSPVDDPFQEGLYTRVNPPLDAEAMHRAGQALLGRQDFASFMSAGSTVESTIRNVTKLVVQRQGEYVSLHIAADGFLYNMVRIIAGTLLAVGAGAENEGYPERALEAKNRSAAGDTLPPQGLFLQKVFYPEQAFAGVL